ncbi:MAG TPA: nitroreductase/quinone reductase family protein [Candidatus Binatia bacterium]|jgi:hypothetical protein
MKFPRFVVQIANAITNAALLAGIPRPPYTRNNALIVETRGRVSGKRRRLPVGFLDDGGSIIVVVEDGTRAQWVQNALSDGGRLRIFLRGQWRQARLRIIEGPPEPYLEKMNRIHAAFVRHEASTPAVIELLPE